MSAEFRRAAALVAMIGPVLWLLLPPEHIHRPAAGLSGAVVIHRHLGGHAAATRSSRARLESLESNDDDAQVLDDVCTPARIAPIVAPTFAVLHAQTPLKPPVVRQSMAPELVTSIHDPPHLPVSFRAPPFQS